MLLYVREIALRRVLQFVSVLIFVCVTSTSNALALTDPGDWWFNSYDTSNGGQMLSTKQIDWCYSNMDKRQSSEVSAIGLIQNVLNDCVNPAKKGPCSVLLLDQSNPSKGTEYTCDVSRTSESEPIAKAINESIVNEPNQLVALLCGTAVTDSQAEAIRPCAKAVRKAYYTPACYYHNGRDSKDGTATDQFTATCVYNAVKSNPVIRFMKPVAAIKDAISQGRKGTQDAIDGALKDVASKNDCEKSGGTWKDNKCQQKEDTSTCNIEGGLSWVICPVMNTLASINDTAFGALKNFLEIDAKAITNKDIKGAWDKFRDIANVAFIGAFLVVIYSIMTGMGVSNYGIKKIVPRIIIVAVLINISFWVCALMVDISNIVGSSIYKLLGDSIAIGGGESGHEGWNAVVGGLLTLGMGVALVVAIAFAPTVFLAVAVVLIILVARQAFVVLLIAMSPLAFAAYLLPNTEQWFKKWWKAFVAVLMVYPTVGLVFGASTLASRVLGTSDDKLMQIAALAVMGIPLFAVPVLLKGAMSAAGSIGQKLAGLQDRANRATSNRLKSKAGEFGNDMSNRWKTAAMDPENRLGKSKLGSYSRWRNRRDRARKDREGAAERAASYSYSNAMVDKDEEGNYTARAKRLQKSAAGGIGVANEKGMARVEALATQAAHKQFDENVSAFKTMHSGKSNKQILDELEKGEGSDEYLASLAGTIMSRDHRDSHVDALRIIGKKAKNAERAGDKNVIETISNIQKQMSADMKDKPWALGDQAAGQLVNGTYGLSTDHNGESQPQLGDIDSEMKDRVGKKLSAQGLANMNPDEMRAIYQMAQGTHSSGVRLDDTELANLKSKIEELRSSRYKDDVKPEAKEWHDKILQDAGNIR